MFVFVFSFFVGILKRLMKVYSKGLEKRPLNLEDHLGHMYLKVYLQGTARIKR